MPFLPREGDLSINELCARVLPAMRRGNATFYMKWTCPDCGDRVTSDQPLTLVTQEGRTGVGVPPGYVHTERGNGEHCGRFVQINEHVFGVLMIATVQHNKKEGTSV